MPEAPGSLTPARIALIYEGGAVTVLDRGQLAEEDLTGLHHAWVWSAEAAPRRVDREDLEAPRTAPTKALAAALDKAVGELLDDGDDTPLTVRLPRVPPEGFPPGTVVASAPEPMWSTVPETALPAWPVPEDGRLTLPRDPNQSWRVRVIGPGLGTPWSEVARGRASVDLFPRPAPTRHITIVGDGDEPLPGTYVKILEGSLGRDRPRVLALFVSDAAGGLEIPAFAGGEAVALSLFEPGHAPRVWTGRPADLPPRLRLAAGSTVSGRFTDPRGEPVAGVRVQLDGWLADDATALYLDKTTSGEDGRWEISQAPRRTLALSVRAAGYAALRQKLEVARERLDLGDLVLTPGVELPLRVVDDTGAPVPGAQASAAGGAEVTADGEGLAVLRSLAPRERLEVRGTAPGHLPAELRLTPPLPEQARLVLPRALTVSGRFTAAEGRPLPEASVRIETGNRSRFEDLDGGGFELDLPPEVASRLVFTSPETASLTVPVPPGVPGEVRDLGELPAPPGLVVAGRVLSALDGTPVPGARVWMPRPSPHGPRLAWVEGDLLRVTTDTEGAFELRGLPAAPGRLRIDAAGFARAYRDVRPAEEETRIELGEVTVSPGTTVEIEGGGEAPGGAQARLDLLGEGLELDMLTAPLVEGVAEIRQVPPGTATLTVVTERRVLCEKQITVPESREPMTVECRGRRTEVHGRVLLGGSPSGSGLLLWSRAAASPHEGLIYNRLSPGGIRQQQTYGAVSSDLTVAVDGRGAFTASELGPGAWQVAWVANGHGRGEPREVVIPEVDDYAVVLEFPGGAVTGVVVDGEGQPVPAARVENLDGGALTLSDADGGFELSGLSPGRYRLRARSEERVSSVEAVEVVAGEPSDPLRLELSDDNDGRLEVTLLGPSGEPAVGGFVFLEAEGQSSRMLSADLRGQAAFTFLPPYPPRVRLAAFLGGLWSFTPWTPWERTRDGLVSSLEVDTGGLLIRSAELRGSVAIEGPQGWDLSRLLMRLGNRPAVAPERPFHLEGLPEGGYTVSLAGRHAQVDVARGKVRDLELE